MTTFNEAFRFFLQKAFDIREGEVRRAMLMQVNIFLIISTLLVVKPTVNGLFLSKFGVGQLPVAFILVAVTAAVVSTVYSRILTKIPLNKILTGTLVFSVSSLVVLGLFLRLNVLEGPVLYVFYIWVAIFALLATSQFWVLANLVFNPREAKRLFGFIGAGAIGGGIFGGYLTSVIAQLTSSENLLFVAALLLMHCIPINRKIWEENVAGTSLQAPVPKRADGFAGHPANLIRESRHLTYIAGIVGVSVVVAKLVDYQFGGIASAMIPDADRLTAFFGFWFSTFNVISLLLQLFLTRRVVGTFGVGTSLFFLPGLILGATLLLLIFPALLPAAIFLKMSDGSLKQSINKAAMELIILPVPVDVKNQTKTFIDVFVDSLATGISGLILIFLIKGLDLPTQAISLMMVALILLWMYLANRVRGEYLRAFKFKISGVNHNTHPAKPFDLTSAGAIAGLKKVLESGQERQILFVLEKIMQARSEDYFEELRKLLYHPSAKVRAAALGTLFYDKKHSLAEEAEPLVDDPDTEVKIQAFEYLIEHSPKSAGTLMNRYLRDGDYQVSGTALITLARNHRDNLRMKNTFGLEERIRERLNTLPHIEDPEQAFFEKMILLQAIGYAGIPALHGRIAPFLNDGNEEIVNQAILSAGETQNPVFIDPLVEFLAHERYRNSARQALIRYDRAILPHFAMLFKIPGTNPEVLRAIPSVVKKIVAQPSVDFLFELFDHEDAVVRQEALRGLNLLHNTDPHLKFDKKHIIRRIFDETHLYQDTLSVLHTEINIESKEKRTERDTKLKDARQGLINVLEHRLDRNLERIFRLLGLNYSSEDILTIYKGLRSKKPDLRLNALEFLDNLLEPNLKKALIPIIETAMLETITEEAIQKLNLRIPSEFECFKMLLNGHDRRVKLAVLYLIGQLEDERYWTLVKEQMSE